MNDRDKMLCDTTNSLMSASGSETEWQIFLGEGSFLPFSL